MPESLRAFVAVWPTRRVRELISSALGDLAKEMPGYRWVKPENLHVTLQFLGDLERAAIAPVIRCLDSLAARTTPFHVSLGRAGAFGPPGRPRVLWLDLCDPDRRLERLAAEVSRALKDLGFSPDKPFVAHLTLARKKEGAGEFVSMPRWEKIWEDSLRRTMRGLEEDSEAVGWAVSSITLVESVLTPEGPRYTVLHESSFPSVVPGIPGCYTVPGRFYQGKAQIEE